jgi:hypothetical protein
MEQRCNDTDRGKPKNSAKNLTQCHFVHHKSNGTDLVERPRFRGENPATNRLSYGTAKTILFAHVVFVTGYRKSSYSQSK